MTVTQMLEESDAYRRGLRPEDILVRFAGREMGSVNQFKNVLGIYPKGWRLPLVFRRIDPEKKETTKHEVLVRLLGVQPRFAPEDPEQPDRPRPGRPPRPGQPPRPGEPPQPAIPQRAKPPPDHPGLKFYEEKTGFANHYFNKLERQRLLEAFKKHGDFSGLTGTWTFEADAERPVKAPVKAELGEKTTKFVIADARYELEPLKADLAPENLAEPRGSGGLLMALYQWRRFLVVGEKGFEGGFAYGGFEPYYPDGTPASRISTEVMNTEHGTGRVKWFFEPKDHTLLGFECYLDWSSDPCEVVFLDYRQIDGRKLPHRITVRHGDKEFASYVIRSWGLTAAKAEK
jgi:hypothetical protein